MIKYEPVSLKHDGTDGQPVLWQTGQTIKTGQLNSCWWNRRTVYTDGTAGLGAGGTPYNDGTYLQLFVGQMR